MALLIMAICTVLFENIAFKIKRAQGARDNQFFFQNVQNNEMFDLQNV